MTCPHCGAEHKQSTPCQWSAVKAQERQEKHPLPGLDNPFWKPEKPAPPSF